MLDARRTEGALGGCPEIERPVARDVVTECLAERRRYFLSDLD